MTFSLCELSSITTTSRALAGPLPLRSVQEEYHDLLRGHLPSFIAKSFAALNPGTEFLPNWHIGMIAEHLIACQRGEITRLLINMPPRMLKSLSVSIAWPAFVLGAAPHTRILLASYAQSLSTQHALQCRSLLQSLWYRALFPDTRLRSDQNQKHKFLTTRNGMYFATSTGGTLTGEGGDILIVDDPLTPTAALSRSRREAANRWFQHTFSSRLNDKRRGVMVVVMQRLHSDDLSGYLHERGGWEHLCLPARAPRAATLRFGTRTRHRAEGEPLHPEREDEAMLARAERELGSYAFAAQYQQDPVPEGGHMVQPRWLRRFDTPPEEAEIVRIIQSWDTAIKAGAQHDASACATLVQTQEGYYLLDMTTLRAEYPALKRRIEEHAEAWQPHVLLLEDQASGQSLLQDLKPHTHLPLIGVRPTRDKVTRLAAVSALIEAGKLHLPRHAPWLAAFERELLSFPHARHDDQVDALSQCLNWLRSHTRTGQPTLRRL